MCHETFHSQLELGDRFRNSCIKSWNLENGQLFRIEETVAVNTIKWPPKIKDAKLKFEHRWKSLKVKLNKGHWIWYLTISLSRTIPVKIISTVTPPVHYHQWYLTAKRELDYQNLKIFTSQSLYIRISGTFEDCVNTL